MATVILVRHGRSTANTSGVLAGRRGGVKLDETGVGQAERAGARIAAVPLALIAVSPLERCRQTARHIAAARSDAAVPETRVARGLLECDYGEWTGRPIKALAKEPLWTIVQRQPSAAAFPGGESLAAMSARAVAAVRGVDQEVTATHGPDAVWVAVTHGDIIKAVLADALGMHLDLFQRLHVDPGSLSTVRYTEAQSFVLGTNTHEGDLAWLAPTKRSRRRAARGDAVVGGGAGPE